MKQEAQPAVKRTKPLTPWQLAKAQRRMVDKLFSCGGRTPEEKRAREWARRFRKRQKLARRRNRR